MAPMVRRLLIFATLALALVGTTGIVQALTVRVSPDGYMYACYSNSTGEVRLRNKGGSCGRGWIPTKWYAVKPEAEPLQVALESTDEVTLTTELATRVVDGGSVPSWPNWHVTATMDLTNGGSESATATCALRQVFFNDDSPEGLSDGVLDTATVMLAPAGSSGDRASVPLVGIARYGFGSHPVITCQAWTTGSAGAVSIAARGVLIQLSLE